MPLLLLLLLIFVSTAQAEGLEAYQDIYGDTKAALEVDTQDDLIYQRLKTIKYEPIDRVLEDQEEKDLVTTGVSSTLDIGLGASRFQSRVLDQYDFERETLEFETQLLERLRTAPVLSDELENNGGFDLIADLNVIDEILFWDQSKKTEPKFALTDSALGEGQEDWQIGDPRSVESQADIGVSGTDVPDVFDEGAQSISAALEDMMEYEGILLGKSLNLEYPAKRFFDTGQAIAKTAETIELIDKTFKTPQSFDAVPEVVALIQVSPRELIKPILTRYVRGDDEDYFSDLDRQVAGNESINIQKRIRTVFLELQSYAVLRGGQIYDRDQQNYLYDQVITHLGRHIDSMKTQILEVESSLEKFYDKPLK